MKVLIVDESFACRTLLGRPLSRYSECHEATDGVEAIFAFKAALEEKRPYDLILLDVEMVRMNGLETLTAIRDVEILLDLHPADRVKVIMVFTLESSDHVLESMVEGCDGHLRKPINGHMLHVELQKLGFIFEQI